MDETWKIKSRIINRKFNKDQIFPPIPRSIEKTERMNTIWWSEYYLKEVWREEEISEEGLEEGDYMGSAKGTKFEVSLQTSWPWLSHQPAARAPTKHFSASRFALLLKNKQTKNQMMFLTILSSCKIEALKNSHR